MDKNKWIYVKQTNSSHETYHEWQCPKCKRVHSIEEYNYKAVRPDKCSKCGFIEKVEPNKLPKFYQPLSCRKVEKKKRQLVYAIGEEQINEHDDASYGMWFGPNPDLNAVLEEEGRSANSRIVRFNEDETDDVIYLWNNKKKRWEYVDE